jgi:hypothetical protein
MGTVQEGREDGSCKETEDTRDILGSVSYQAAGVREGMGGVKNQAGGLAGTGCNGLSCHTMEWTMVM